MNFNKKILGAIIGVLIILVVGVGIYFSKLKGKQSFIKTVPVNISEDQKNQILDKIKKQEDIAKNSSSTSNDKMGAYLDEGINYKSLGQLGDAEEAFKKAADAEPSSGLPWSALASLYIDMNNYDAAKDAFQKTLSLAPSSALDWQKWIDFNRYQLKVSSDQVKKLYQDAFSATHDDINLHRQYASYLEDIGDKQGSVDAWVWVLTNQPGDKQANAEIIRLRAAIKAQK